MKTKIFILILALSSFYSVHAQCTPPQPVSPENGSTINTLTPTLCWSSGYNFSPPVDLQISTEPSLNYPCYELTLFEWPGCHTVNPGALTYNHWYWWRIRVNCYPGYYGYSQVYSFQTAITAIQKISSEVPEYFYLFQNYPNPFNPKSKIKYQIAKLADAKLVIIDVLGREVATLVNERLSPGTYEVEWNASNYPSGVYLYKIITSEYIDTKKMVLIK